jgi:hypothetical protein
VLAYSSLDVPCTLNPVSVWTTLWESGFACEYSFQHVNRESIPLLKCPNMGSIHKSQNLDIFVKCSTTVQLLAHLVTARCREACILEITKEVCIDACPWILSLPCPRLTGATNRFSSCRVAAGSPINQNHPLLTILFLSLSCMSATQSAGI